MPIQVTNARKNEVDYELNHFEKKQYQQLLGKLQWITSQTRPDVRFKVLMGSIKASKPTVADMIYLNSVVAKLKKRQVTLVYPKFSSDITKLTLYAFADAALSNLPDGTSSTRGSAIFLVSGEHAGILSWASRKIKVVTKTIVYAEGVALSQVLDEAILLRETILSALRMTKDPKNVPISGFTDSHSLFDNINSSHQSEDLRLRREVASLRQQLNTKEVQKIYWVPDEKQLADPLTKKDAKNPAKLLNVIETGILNFDPCNC